MSFEKTERIEAMKFKKTGRVEDISHIIND